MLMVMVVIVIVVVMMLMVMVVIMVVVVVVMLMVMVVIMIVVVVMLMFMLMIMIVVVMMPMIMGIFRLLFFTVHQDLRMRCTDSALLDRQQIYGHAFDPEVLDFLDRFVRCDFRKSCQKNIPCRTHVAFYVKFLHYFCAPL